MDLWIRSQDREYFTPNPTLEIREVSSKFHILDVKNEDGFLVGTMLGEYKTKERALEVLDEIQKKINMINLGHDFGSPMIDLNNPTYIYKMPKE